MNLVQCLTKLKEKGYKHTDQRENIITIFLDNPKKSLLLKIY